MKNFFVLCWVLVFTVMTIGAMLSGGGIIIPLIVWMFVGVVFPASWLEH